MMDRQKCCVAVAAVLLVPCLAAGAFAADWPAYKADAARSGVTAEKLTFPLAKVWAYRPLQSPKPAWPEPGKELHRLDFDYSFQPVVSLGFVYFGSSADDSLRALDVASGEFKWRLTAGGPIRFAPAVARGKAYVASDDGRLYCLNATTGKLLWKVRGAPSDEQMLGNGRMISRWPVRSGVLVSDGVVYFAAGMWPAQGIYVYALDAETGERIWCNDSSGNMYVNQPHGGASAFTGVCPQGYMLASGNLLLIPSGRATPAAYDRRTGKLVYYQPYLHIVPYSGEGWASRANGGSWATIAGDIFFSPMHRGGAPDIDIAIGESAPRPGDGLVVYSLATGMREINLPDRHRVLAANGILYAVGNGKLQAIDLAAWRQAKELNGCVKWTVPHPRAYSLALAENALLVGGAGTVTAFDADTGTQVWSSDMEGQVRGIAVADGRIVAATNNGSIVCFEHVGMSGPMLFTIKEKPTWELGIQEKHAALAGEIAAASGISAGYALVIGEPDAKLAAALASRTELHVISLLHGTDKVDAERERVLTSDLHGTRVAVQGRESFSRLPYASYFADMIVVTGETRGLSGKELYRILRPCGGVLCFSGAARRASRKLIKQAGIPRAEIQPGREMVMVKRGKLPGAGEWRTQWADGGNSGIGQESRIRFPLDILWFGGPGPDRMMSRHWGGSAPLSVAGRTFVAGQHHVIAFDVYNGRELWCTEMEGVGRKGAQGRSGNFVADDDSLYATVGRFCHRLDQATGKTLLTYHIPEELTKKAAAAREVPPEPKHIDLEWPAEWQVFGPFAKDSEPLTQVDLKHIPREVTVGEKTYQPRTLAAVNRKLEFSHLYGGYGYEPLAPGQEPEENIREHHKRDMESERLVVYAFARINCPTAGRLRIGAGSDWWMEWYLDGKPFFDTLKRGNVEHPYTITNHVFSTWANAGEHVLAVMVKAGSMGWCLVSAGGAKYDRIFDIATRRAEEELEETWGYLSVAGDLVLGTHVRAGGGSEGTGLFALNRNDGSLRWLYPARSTILNTCICFGDGRVFLVDVPSPAQVRDARNRGEELVETRTLMALDLDTGGELWRQEDVPWGNDVRYANKTVVIGGKTAYDAVTGGKLWHNDVSPRKRPLILGNWVIGQPYAYDLRTGKQRMVADIVTGEKRPWKFLRAYGCGPVAGCRSLLFFRSGTAGFFDFRTGGTTTFGGMRPGCSITMVPANGLVVLPEGSSGCSCSYNFQTSLALIPGAAGDNSWYVFAGGRSAQPLKHLRLNFGAPGDRRDANRTAWLGFPRPVLHGACPVPATASGEEPDWYYHPSQTPKAQGTAERWLYSSGLCGEGELSITLVPVSVTIPFCDKAPAIDGKLDDPCWQGIEPTPFENDAHLLEPKSEVYLRRDAENLYFAFTREAAVRDGQPVPFVATQEGTDVECWQDDDFEVFLTDREEDVGLYFAVSCAGGRFEGQRNLSGGGAARPDWNGRWTGAVGGTERYWSAEIAIPLKTLSGAGVNPGYLRLNLMAQNLSGQGQSEVHLTDPGPSGFRRCELFLPVTDEAVVPRERAFTVRLHFAEPGDARTGERVFNIALQGKNVLEDFDIVREAGGPNRAVVKEFTGVRLRDSLAVSFTPANGGVTKPPVVSAIEVLQERE